MTQPDDFQLYDNKITPHTPPRRRGALFWSGMVFFLCVLALTIAFAICEWKGWPFLRAPFERFASEQLQRDIRIAEPFQLKLLGSVRLKVGGLWIGVPEGFDAPHFADTRTTYLQLRYSDLFKLKHSDQLRIQTLEVDRIDLHLLRKPDGKSTWHFKQDDNEPDKPFPVIERLIATAGHAEVRDAKMDVDLDVDFSTHEGGEQAHPASSVTAKGTFRDHQLEAKLTTEGFLPIATQAEDSPPIRSKGWVNYGGLRIDYEGSVSDLFGHQNIVGKFTGRGPSLHVLGALTGTVLPTTDKFSLRGTMEKHGDLWKVDIPTARIGSSQLGGNFQFDPRPQRPLLSGQLFGKRLVLEDLFPAFGGDIKSDDVKPADTKSSETKGADHESADTKQTSTKPAVAAPAKTKLFADRKLDLPTLNKMDADLSIKLDYVDLGKAFAKPISPFVAKLSMDSGKLALAEVDARTADGAISGLISVDAHQDATAGDTATPADPKWHIDMRWKDIDLEKWLQVSQDRKAEAQREGKEIPPAYVTGTLNGKTKLDGKGNSTKELMGSLQGDVSMYIEKGTISRLLIELMGIDLAQSLGVWLTKDKALPMECAVMDFGASQGIVKPRVALIDTSVTTVLIDGHVDLAEELLNLRLSAKPKNMSPFTLRSPIRVTGTFVNPDVAPEGGPIAARVAGSVALAFLNPIAAILPFIDLGGSTDKAPSPCKRSLSDFSQQAR
jgi:uncharacterized protein involved in outer membrane biogenesis